MTRLAPCNLRRARELLLVAALALCSAASAQPAINPNEVLVENKWAKVTRADYEIELQRLPPDLRGGFGANPRRVVELANRILLAKSLAVQARDAGLEKDATNQQRLALELDKLIGGLWIAKIEEDAARAFDARRAQFEAVAREVYLTDHKKYEIPEQVGASHILFDLKKHTREEGLELARGAKAKIAAGADFGQLARDISDDPTAARNSGSVGYFAKTEMDPAFSSAAWALVKVGDVSDPVLSSFGWHLIRLDGRHAAVPRSFDEVKESILVEMRKKYIDEQRDAAVRGIVNDASTKSNAAALDALVVRIDPALAKQALPEPPAGGVAPK
jgi:peptidyl-prolyl cis-trans isomerase C